MGWFVPNMAVAPELVLDVALGLKIGFPPFLSPGPPTVVGVVRRWVVNAEAVEPNQDSLDLVMDLCPD